MKKRIFAIIFALFMLVFIPVCSHAEFGEFAGDSDYGYDSGGYDSGSYDNDYDYDYDDDDDDRNYNNNSNKEKPTYYAYVYGSHTDDDSFGGHYDSKGNKLSLCTIKNDDDNEANYSAVLGAIIVGFIAIGVIVIKRSNQTPSSTYNKYTPTSKPVNPGAQMTPVDTLQSMGSYTSVDKDFSEAELREKVSNIYIQMQNCWQNKNLEQLRPYFTDALYAQYDRQLEHYRKSHETNVVERIAVLGVEFRGWRTARENDEIIALVRTRIVDYVIDDSTQNVIRGNRNKEKFMTYEWTLSRKSGVKTTASSGTRVVTCPQCGAPIDINKSAKCEYCGSIVTVDSSDWLISEIKGIAQRTGN